MVQSTPMFPLQSAMLPGESLPLRVFEPRYGALVRDCLATDDPAFGVVLIARGREVGGGDERHSVGALARIVTSADHGSGNVWSLLELIAGAREIRLRSRSEILGDLPDEPGDRLYALAARVPIGTADKYDVLAAPGPVQRLAVLRDAVETVTAMVRFQLTED